MVLETPSEMALSAAGRFRQYRKLNRVTLKELSERSGVPYSTIRRFESCGEISFVSLVKLASTLRLDDQIDALFAEQVPTTMEEVLRANRR